MNFPTITIGVEEKYGCGGCLFKDSGDCFANAAVMMKLGLPDCDDLKSFIYVLKESKGE